MKTIITSVGLVALGALAVPSAQAQDNTKPWNVSASLHGFYDDNWTTLPSKDPNKRSSFGFDLSPSAGYKNNFELADVDLSYIYTMKYYEARTSNRADHGHQADMKLTHEFPERLKLSLTESFVVSQEPQVLDTTAVVTTPLRSNGNNIRNSAGLTASMELTRTVSLESAYNIAFYAYDQTGTDSRSALLDRIEQLVRLDARWKALETTVWITGYQFGYTDQTSGDLITGVGLANTRNSRSHYGYVGVDQTFNPQLIGSARVGMQYTEYPNAALSATTEPGSTVTPYVDLSGTYAYSPEGSVQLGIKHNRNQTDVSAGTLDAASTTVYSSVNHKFYGKLTASLIAQYQLSEFRGGIADGKADNLFLAGLNLSYELIKGRLSAEGGYNYDRLDSDLTGRSFYRNRVFLGLKATY